MQRLFVRWLMFIALSVIFLGCGDNVLEFTADKESRDACRVATTRNLDQGNYDEVLSSECVNNMQMGAAYFGKAGFDIKDVINKMSETTSEGSEDLSVLLGSFTGTVTSSNLTDLTNAKNAYAKVAADDPSKKDAVFYSSLVSASKSMSLIKTIIDSDGDGKLLSDCDINNNSVPDDADALGCALAEAALGCSTLMPGLMSVTTPANSVTFPNNPDITGTYTGKIISITNKGGTGSNLSECTTDNTYYKLISNGQVITTTSEDCTGSDGNTWKCPIETSESGTQEPLTLVGAIGGAITEAIEVLIGENGVFKDSLDNEVLLALEEIQTQCGANSTTKKCDTTDLFNYLIKDGALSLGIQQ